jgi:hypothetical protein
VAATASSTAGALWHPESAASRPTEASEIRVRKSGDVKAVVMGETLAGKHRISRELADSAPRYRLVECPRRQYSMVFVERHRRRFSAMCSMIHG